MRVYCSDRRESLNVEECLQCPRCLGFSIHTDGWAEDEGPGSQVLCRPRPEGGGAAPDEGEVGQIMRGGVVCAREDLGLTELANLFLAHGISGMPVVDDGGRPMGMVSKTDLVRAWQRSEEPAAREAMTVREIMMPVVFSIKEDTKVGQAAALMACEGIHRLPVVSARGEVVGVISAMDIVRWVAKEQGF
jgi:CBS domain-containing protein